jgi:hypothetical protein
MQFAAIYKLRDPSEEGQKRSLQLFAIEDAVPVYQQINDWRDSVR